MGKLMRKLIAVAAAGFMTASCLSAQSFAAQKPADLLGKTDAQVAYAATVVKPTYSIKGTAGVRKIKLSTTTSGATIYYTKDGSVPTTSSKAYRSGYVIVLRANTKLRAIAVKDGAQSAVMTKTIKIPTLVGDVTGDGNINSNDLSRLNKYLKGSTSFICTDNADCDGNGKINNNDYTLLNQYLRGDISSFPLEDEELDEDDTPSVTLQTPSVTVRRVIGGKQIEIATESGATLYYTTNGSNPTTSSTRYTAPFILTDDATVNVIAYKNGAVSKVKTRAVEVDQCRPVVSDKSTTTNYNDKVDVTLTCATAGAGIYYTTDGSNPETSNTRVYYTRPITLEKNTTIKACAQLKGYATSSDSFDYKVTNTGIKISGTVWDDTPSENSIADGLRSTTDQGINDIVVYLKYANASTYYASTKTKTIDGVAGSYEFTNVPAGSYKVEFYYNTQKYRAYSNIVTTGNQALQNSTIDDMYITYDGAFRTSNSTKVSAINSYSVASTNDVFLGTAITSSTYSATTANVNLALVSNIYGALGLTMTTNQSYYNSKVDNLSTVSYLVTVTNNSPAQTLKDVSVALYMNSALTDVSLATNNMYITGGNLSNGYRVYTVSSILGSSGLAPKASTTFTVNAYVNSTNNTKIANYAEVTSYRYANSGYDRYSIPGNLVVGTVKEKDEAASPVLTVNATSTKKTLDYNWSLSGSTQTLAVGSTHTFTVFIDNSTAGASDLTVVNSNSNAILYATNQQKVGSGYNVTFQVVGIGSTSDYSRLTVALKDDSTQGFSITYYIVR